jgi:hypothetical protein
MAAHIHSLARPQVAMDYLLQTTTAAINSSPDDGGCYKLLCFARERVVPRQKTASRGKQAR